MNKKLQKIISQYSDQQQCLNSIVVSSFAKNNSLNICGGLLNDYMRDDLPVIDIMSMEDVINVFALAIPKTEKTKNGAIYTPKYIRDYILDKVIKTHTRPLQECYAIDVACGCGAFLYSLVEYIYVHCGLSYGNAIKRIYGVDVSELSVKRCKILLALAALQHGESINDEDFNIYQGNSLDFDFLSIPEINNNGGFDIVVGNPPYVRAKHIDEESKALLPQWQVAKCGNADLYLPFFEIGYNILRKDGVLGYITLNSFFKSVNARLLRAFFRQKNISLEIVDFGDQLVFGKTLAYTCVAFVTMQGKAGINYAKGQINANGFTELPQYFSFISYSKLNDHKGWNLNNIDVMQNIDKLENIGQPLGEMFPIKNGIATLANDIYIFKPIKEDKKYYYLQLGDTKFPIEKAICRDIIKPNILHSEEEIPNIIEKVIFPYDEHNKILNESVFTSKYPKAYEYLLHNKIKLACRDKGEKTYEAWFAFGRTQAIGDSGRKLLFPYMASKPHFVYTDNEKMLIYCGYAIFSESEKELLMLKRILESSVFDYYMRNTAKPYAANYYSYAKNYVKGFGIPVLNKKQRDKLLSLQDRNDINDYVEKLYDIHLDIK